MQNDLVHLALALLGSSLGEPASHRLKDHRASEGKHAFPRQNLWYMISFK
jgi:hypothetical protein